MSGELDAGVIASFSGAICLYLLMPVAAVAWARRRLEVEWKVVGMGALAFALSQLLTRVPAVQVAQYFLKDTLKASSLATHVWLVVLSLTAGLFEETARLIAFKYPLKGYRHWKDAVGFGVGHGGLECALLVGGLGIIGLINVVVLTQLDLSTLKLPPEQLEQLRAGKEQVAALQWWEPLLGVYERIGALLLHVALSVLVLQRFLRGQRRWYWLAVGFHALTNELVSLAARGLGKVAAEGVMTVAALLSLWIILRLRDRRMPA
ncbi:YhfC family intramembrane metalloprotease [Stigmatella aurantiaca]|uniref:Membrane protein n=1 Tax=Stigmatella aurantiaca (strain DW4/3-1) TaxID=378806 RepID=Q08ZN2_STIAD|nr:YhfC family intramembrane metalloprotease [Stigmatella aurantiaca]ADO68232.1 membrane protein [Stigmatella aurantiaca DW4/3-1]EAU65934.1 membrane protein [Stigmatella aurantiaca DW4/3-1]